MRLLGISGLKTSGKDTTAKAVAAALPDQNVQRVAFADKLKELAALAFGVEDDLIARMDYAKEHWTIKIHGEPEQDIGVGDFEYLSDSFWISGRAYLQNIGQAARKVFQDGFWVDQILPPLTGHSLFTTLDQQHHLQHFYPGVDVLCVTDVRYPNEADRVHELGGEVWEIIRPGTESDGHSSEIPLESSKVDMAVYNGYTIEELYQVVDDLLSARGYARATC